MNAKQFHQHVTILGVIHLVGGALFAVIGIFVFLLLTGIGAAVAVEDPVAPRVLFVVGTAVGLLMALLSLPGIAAGFGLLKRRSWGRILALAVGILNLLNVPIGTIIGAYTLYVLLQPEATAYFEHEKTR
jgi:hypothetical protein